MLIWYEKLLNFLIKIFHYYCSFIIILCALWEFLTNLCELLLNLYLNIFTKPFVFILKKEYLFSLFFLTMQFLLKTFSLQFLFLIFHFYTKSPFWLTFFLKNNLLPGLKFLCLYLKFYLRSYVGVCIQHL